jgi:chitinase
MLSKEKIQKLLCFIVAVILSSRSICSANHDQLVVVGYLPDYRIASVSSSQVQGVTHLVYFSLTPTVDGQIAESPIPTPTLAKLRELKEAIGCRLVLCVGGWGRSDGFAKLTSNAESLNRLVQGLVNYCRANGFDGIDYDWEHPNGATELAAYVRLIRETKRAMQPHGMEVSVAQAGWQDLGKDAYELVDRIHLMAYEQEYPQSTLANSLREVEQLQTWGCPPQKITLGVPFYGRNKSRESKTYAELVGSRSVDPSINEIDGFAFNGKDLIRSKTQAARERGLAGVMIWELAQDSRRDDASLLKAIIAK